VTALTILGAGSAVLTLLGLAVALHQSSQPPPYQALPVLQVFAALTPLFLLARYPLLAWRIGYLVALFVPLIRGEPRVEYFQAVLLVVVFSFAGLRHARPVLWWMRALMLIPTWLTIRSSLGLDGDDRHVVGDNIVHFPGDARAFLEYRASGLLELGTLDLFDESVTISAGALPQASPSPPPGVVLQAEQAGRPSRPTTPLRSRLPTHPQTGDWDGCRTGSQLPRDRWTKKI
jgi:hypothetical protein